MRRGGLFVRGRFVLYSPGFDGVKGGEKGIEGRGGEERRGEERRGEERRGEERRGEERRGEERRGEERRGEERRGEERRGEERRGGVRKDKKTSLYSLLKVKQVCVEEKKPPPPNQKQTRCEVKTHGGGETHRLGNQKLKILMKEVLFIPGPLPTLP